MSFDASTPSSTRFIGRLSRLPSGLIELLLLLAAVALLWWSGSDLGDLTAGRGGRYELALNGSNSLRAERTQWLLRNCGYVLTVMALTGWAVLTAGRRSPRPIPFLLFTATMWGLTAAALWWQLPWLLALSAAIVAAMLKSSAKFSSQDWLLPTHPAIYPLFTLLTGLGLLWLLSFASMSAATVKGVEERLWMGYQHATSLFIAYVALTTLAGVALPILSRMLAWFGTRVIAETSSNGRFAAVLKRVAKSFGWLRVGRSGLLCYLSLFLCLSYAIAVILMYEASRTRAELLNARLQAGVWACAIPLLAFCFIRFRDNLDLRSFLKNMLFIGLLMVSAFLVAHDYGQVLLLGIAFCALFFGLTAIIRNKKLVLINVAALLGLVSAVLITQFHVWMPEDWSKMLGHVQERIYSVKNPYSGLDDLSKMRWFQADAPLGGHGLVRTPWCGTTDEFIKYDPNDPKSDTGKACRGMMRQTASDYVFTALVGVWGSARAWLIVALTAIYFLLGCTRPNLPETRRHAQAQRFGDWMIRIFAALSLVQLFLSVLGNIGVMIPTFLTFPLLGYGGVLLILVAVFGALTVNRCKG